MVNESFVGVEARLSSRRCGAPPRPAGGWARARSGRRLCRRRNWRRTRSKI